ncbi:MAG: DUF1990 family protein [Pseudolysinimonas sp.]
MDAAAIWRTPVTYGAIGGTRAADLMQYPPKGFRPLERRVRIGNGPLRWVHAWVETLTGGMQRRAGMRVQPLEAPVEVTTGTYVPVAFADDGTPVQPATTGELVYAPDGAPLLRPGDTAILRIPLYPGRIPARVVYVIDEPLRKGFAYGTLPGHPERGEEAFVVEYRDDDSVWLTIRAFSRPANALFWLGYPVLRLLQEFFTRRYERALAGPIEGENP